jgi:hypothetical protein
MNPDPELLISRVCEDHPSAEDWRRLVAAAELEPALWRELALTRRDQQSLCAAVDRATAVADRIDLPLPAASNVALRGDASVESTQVPLIGMLRSWGGWALAASLLLAFAWQWGSTPRIRPHETPAAPLTARGMDAASPLAAGTGVASSNTAHLMSDGELLGEMPERILLDIRPAADGTFDVLSVRQLIERQNVTDLFVPHGQDERGRATLVRYDAAPGKSF